MSGQSLKSDINRITTADWHTLVLDIPLLSQILIKLNTSKSLFGRAGKFYLSPCHDE